MLGRRGPLSKLKSRMRSQRGSTTRARNKRLDKQDHIYNEYNYRREYLPLWSFYRKVLREIIREDISKFRKDYIAKHSKDSKIPCQSTGVYYYPKDMECDHYKPKFRHLAKNFAIEYDLNVTWDMFIKSDTTMADIKPIIVIDNKPSLPVQEPGSPLYAEFIRSLPIHGKRKKNTTNIEIKQKLLLSQASTDNTNIYLAKFIDNTLNDKWIQYHRQHCNLRMINKDLNQRLK